MDLFYICQKYFSSCIIIFVRQISRVVPSNRTFEDGKRCSFLWKQPRWHRVQSYSLHWCCIFKVLYYLHSKVYAEELLFRQFTLAVKQLLCWQCHSKEIYKMAWAKILFAYIKLKPFNSLSSRTLFELQKHCQESSDLLFFTRPCSHAANGPTNWNLRLFDDFLSEL